MSSNYGAQEAADYFYFDNPRYNDVEKRFTDLQSCDLPTDTDSRKNI